MTNRTALRLPQQTIDRLRVLARKKSECSPSDVSWGVVGRELLEKALAAAEQQTRQGSNK